VAIGYQAMRYADNRTSGRNACNTAVGYQSLRGNTTASYNTGQFNTAIGYQSLYSNMYGYHNTASGYQALYSNTSGNNNTALGYYAFRAPQVYSNSTALGYYTNITATNQVRIGNADVTSIGGYAAWTNISDARFKTDVQEDVKGLDFIVKLRPVTYHLDMDAIASFHHIPDSMRISESESLKAEEIQIGFIAQEVESAAKELGFDFHGVDAPKNENDYYGLRYAEFVVPLVKAVQEQQQMIQEQKQMIQAQQNGLKAMQKMIAEQKQQIEALSKQMNKK
jgi:hypothetical protein